MNPNDQPTDHSRQRPGPQTETPAAPADADPAIPSLPSPVTSEDGSDAAPAGQSPEIVNFFQADDDAQSELGPANTVYPVDPQMSDNGKEVVWSAAEFVEHDKSPAWFLTLVGVSVVVIAIIFFVTHDVMNALIVAIAAILFGVAAGRPPRHMQYAVNDHGITIGKRFFDYSNFRSFSVIDEDITRSIMLMPLKRFMPTLTLYYDLDDEQRIGDVLADHLPFAQHELQLTERLMRRIRF